MVSDNRNVANDNKDSMIYVRVTARDLEVIKQVAHLRFLNKALGMNEDNLSEYIRSLVKKDTNTVIEEIKSRRRV